MYAGSYIQVLIFENCHTVSYNLCTNLIWQKVCKNSLLPTSSSVLVIFSLFGNSHSYMVRKGFTRLCCGSSELLCVFFWGISTYAYPSYLWWFTLLFLSLLWFLHILEDGRLSEISRKGRQVYKLVCMCSLKMWVSEMEWRYEELNDQKEGKDEGWQVNVSLQLDMRNKMLIPLHI